MPPLSRPSTINYEQLPYPQCDWLPEYYNTESAYNEDEIVQIITSLYTLLVKLCYLPDDQVAWPSSPGGHDINLTLASEELNLEPAVISLMHRLPYSSKTGGPGLDPYIIFTDARPFNFLDDRDLRDSRSPREYGYDGEECHEALLPQDLCLTAATFQANDDGEYVVLDTRENTIRIISSQYKPFEMPGTRIERPDEPNHYRNNFPRHAPSYLRRQVERLENLDVLPTTPQWGNGFVSSRLYPDIYHEVKSIFVRRYGWPDHYRREEWMRDRDVVFDKAYKRVYGDGGDGGDGEDEEDDGLLEGV